MRKIFALGLASGLVAVGIVGVVRAEQDERPVAQQTKALTEGFQKQAPDVAKTFEDGIREVAATGIADKAPKVGDKAAMFALPDASGKTVKLADLLARGPVVLTWYRGGWCPYCNIGLRGLLKAEPQIRELGATLVAVTPETPENASETMKADKLDFEVLSDRGNAVARSYHIVYKLPEKTSAAMKAFKIDLEKRNGDASDELPLSVTYVIDSHGTIRWAFVDPDYRRRAEPADVVDALKKLKQ